MVVRQVFFHRPVSQAGTHGYLAGHRISGWSFTKRGVGLGPGRLRRSIPHDFRKTAIRNMVRAGILERVAMNWAATRLAAWSIAIMSSAMETRGTFRVGLGNH